MKKNQAREPSNRVHPAVKPQHHTSLKALVQQASLLKTSLLPQKSSLLRLPNLPWKKHTGIVMCMAVSHNELLLASGSEDETIILWAGNTGEQVGLLAGHAGTVYSVCFSDSDEKLVSGSLDMTIGVWNVTSNELIYRLTGHSNDVTSVACLHGAQSHLALSCSDDLSVAVWDICKGERTKEFPNAHAERVTCVKAAPTSSSFASSGMDGVIVLWSLQGATNRLLGHEKGVTCLAYSEDGNVLVSGSDDATCRVWDWEQGICLRVLRGHEAWVLDVQLCGTLLASAGSFDKTIRVWDWRHGQCLHVLIGHNDAVTCVAFYQRSLCSGSRDHTIRYWDEDVKAE